MELQKHTPKGLTKSFSTVLKAQNGLKIKTLTHDEPLRQVIRYIVALVGFSLDKIDKIQTDVIVNFLRNHHEQTTVEELKIAFNLGVSGKLDIDMTHYQNFNSMYFSNVLLSYKRFKAKIIRENPVKKELGTTTTNMDEQCLKAFEEFRKKGSYYDCFNCVYNYLDKRNVLNLTPTRKNEFMEKAKTSVANTKRNETNIKNLLETIAGNKNEIIAHAKRLALTSFFNDLLDTETELAHLL